MIGLALFSLLAIGYRIRHRLFTRAEWALLSVVAVNVSLIWAQIFICDHKLVPESRYYVQSTLLLYPWGIWGLAEILRKRMLPVEKVVAVLLGGFAIHDAVMLAKAHFPVGRRSAYVAACNWARERIAADWTGPVRDADPVADPLREYHTPYRPIVQAHTARLPYLLGGRDTAESVFPEADLPDYWFSDIRRDDPPSDGYQKIDEFRRGKYEFHLYKRK